MFERIHGCAFLMLCALAAPVLAGDDFPITGEYTQNRPCKGDGSDPADVRVKITSKQIESSLGLCNILGSKRDGDDIAANVECQFGGNPLIGDVTFTLRDEKTVDFVDRDNNYKTVLYRCPR